MISGKILRDAIISGANNINNQRSRVDELNVFPVPDGDTGTNMGMTVDQIAEERGFVRSTIIGHLTPYVKEGKVGLRALISSAHEKKIRDFMKAHPEIEHFSEIKEAMGDSIDYSEIKLIRDLMEDEG